jgi:hypothetical protein
MLRRLVDLWFHEVGYSLRSAQFQATNGWRFEKKKILVNGSPKSGTTWMLKMIESIPGYRGVGNFDGNIERYNGVLPGDVVHGHDWKTPELVQILKNNGIKVILLIRDPRDQLVSRVFHIRRVTRHPWHQQMKALSLEDALMLCIEGREEEGLPGARTMIELGQSWILGGADEICVRYEDCHKDPQREFRRVVSHLGIDINDAFLQLIVARNLFERLTNGRKFWRPRRRKGQADPNSHFRKGITGDWKNHLEESHIHKFKEVAGDKLIELGYEQDLSW